MIGSGNRFAHSAALAVAESPGESYNPLFLYGAPGLGKTHLLVSIANYLRRQRPDLPVVYTTAERFTTEFVNSVRPGGAGGAERFKERYREAGALLIDDVQFIEGKARTEEEFFHTFNELLSAGSQIVLSSDRPPEAMGELTDRMRDRFAWGLTVELQGPDLGTRVALLRRLATEHAIPLPDPDALQQIALAAPDNLRRLEGALTRVTALSSMLGEPPTPDLVRRALGGDHGESERREARSGPRRRRAARADQARRLRRPAPGAGGHDIATPSPGAGPRTPDRDVRRAPSDRPLARRDRARLRPRPLDGDPLDPLDREAARDRVRYPQDPGANPRTPPT